MSMQNRIYRAGECWDKFYNDTAVHYSLQVDAWLHRILRKPSKCIGDAAISNVVYVDFTSQGAHADEPTLEVGQGN